MITTLVVDDDFRVARLHAASVDRIEHFGSVGQAHSVAEALALVQSLTPQLLLLDLYLPDGHGLEVIRTLDARQHDPRPDFIVITAAHDVDSLRRAMQLGAMYYLVKPFGFAQLREQLLAYRQLRAGLAEAAVADQEAVDALYGLLHRPAIRPPSRRRLPPTTATVLDAVIAAGSDISAMEVAETVGVSRATAQRHLADLVRRNLVELGLNYGSAGRPEHRFRPCYPRPGGPPGR